MKIIAVDLGDARTGLAVCDRTECLASPVGTIKESSMKKVCAQVANAVTEFDVGMVVVGHPVNMNGTVGDRAKKSEQFADMLRILVKVPVTLWDERSTTVSAHALLDNADVHGKKRREIIDEVAAVVILESYMSYRKSSGGDK